MARPTELRRKSPVNHFLDLLSYWNTNIPSTTQWAVHIDPDAGREGLFSNIAKYSSGDGYFISTQTQNTAFGEHTQPNEDGLGLYFAQSISIPAESFDLENCQQQGLGGYLQGFVGGDRANMLSRKIKTDFLETNLDFNDGVIRPWIIAAAYKGLIFTGNDDSLKSTISIMEYGNSKVAALDPRAQEQAAVYDRNRPLRKMHQFFGAVPTTVSEKTLNYEGESITIRSVEWVFERYQHDIFPS